MDNELVFLDLRRQSDVDQNLLSKFTNTTSDSRISDQHLRSKRTGSLSAIYTFLTSLYVSKEEACDESCLLKKTFED